jgi:hypothetical protein
MADKKISALTAASTPLAGTEVLPIVQSGTTVKVAVSDLTTGRAVSALSLTTATIQAASSAGGTLKNNGGTAQMQWGSGGGSNLSLEVATNINPANAAVNISPTGTGTVTINPATASTMNNVAIGGTTALTGRFTSVTATTGNFVVGTSGQGIDFSATPGTGTSELLADYEEGTWTPVDGSGAGLSFATAAGYYTKIGRLVTLYFTIEYPATANTNAGRVGGLPFTVLTDALSPSGGSLSVNTSAVAAAVPASLQATALMLFSNPSTGGSLTNASLSTGYLRGFVSYMV